MATIIIRGSSQSRIDDVERAVDDAVNTYKALTKDAKVIFPKTLTADVSNVVF